MRKFSAAIWGTVSGLLLVVAGCTSLFGVKYGPPPPVVKYGPPPPQPKVVAAAHDARKTLKKGDSVHLTATTDMATMMRIRVSIPGQPLIDLYNDGTHGDKVPGDTVQEVDYQISGANTKVTEARVTASAENGSSAVAKDTISIDP